MQKSAAASRGSHGNELIYSGDRQCDVIDDVTAAALDDVIDDAAGEGGDGTRCVEEAEPSDSLILPYAHLSPIHRTVG